MTYESPAFHKVRPMSNVKAALQNSPLFAHASDQMLETVLRQSDQKTFEVGELIMNEGDPCDCVLVVLEGRLVVMVRRDWGEERILTEI